MLSSVAMLSTAPHSLFGPSSLELPKFESDPFAAIKKGPLGISKPTQGLKGSRGESFEVKQEWSAVAFNAPAWDVCGKELEMIPADFPLERTHREIKEDAAIVASRITEALRIHSIQSEFDCKNAKAKCLTRDCVNFRIRLYAGGENGQPVVVEVQRRSGSSSSFMRSCRVILSAAEGDICKEKEERTKAAPYVKKPINQMKCLANVIANEEEKEQVAMSALEGVIDMIRANREDLTLMGIENLCSLTDPLKTCPVTALNICKDIMMGSDSYDIREEIRVLADRDVFVPEFDHENLPSHSEQVRLLTLRVFSNCLSICNQDAFLASIVKEQMWFRENLIPTLVDEIKRAKSAANNAYEAATCVSSLVSCSDVARKAVVINGGITALEEANKFGAANHELLAEETRRCLDMLRK